MSTQFDPIDYAQQLEAAGVPERQASVHAKTLAEVLARCVALPHELTTLERDVACRIKESETNLTRRIDALESKIDAMAARLDDKIDAVAARLDDKIDAVAARLDAVAARLDAKIDAVEARMSARMDAFESKVEARLAKMSGEIALLRWMTGTSIAMNIAILLKLFAL